MSDRQPEERTDKRTEMHACDLICRQAALKIVAKHIGIDGDRACLIDVGKTYGEIYALPPVQPELIRCKDCKWSDWYTAADGNRYCYCMETGAAGRTEDDYCSYAERETNAANRRGCI